jgi:membrane protein
MRSSFNHAKPLLRHPLHFLWEAVKAFRANQGLLLAGAVAYYALLSMVPLLIVSVIALSHFMNQSELLGTIGRCRGSRRRSSPNSPTSSRIATCWGRCCWSR